MEERHRSWSNLNPSNGVSSSDELNATPKGSTMSDRTHFSVHLSNLLREAVEANPGGAILARPAQIAQGLLAQVARRAIELDDPELNALMLELALYEVNPRERPGLVAAQRARIVTTARSNSL